MKNIFKKETTTLSGKYVKPKKSFSGRMSLAIVTFNMVLMIICVSVIGNWMGKVLVSQAKDNTMNALDATIGDIELMLNDVEVTMKNAAWMAKDCLDTPDYLFTITRQVEQGAAYIVGSAIAFEPNYFPSKGYWFAPYSCYDSSADEHISFQLGNTSNDYFKQEWYLEPKIKRRDGWCKPYYDIGGAMIKMTTYSVPLIDSNGHFIGVITADVSLKDLTMMVEDVKPYENSLMLVVSGTGEYLAHPDSTFVLNKKIQDVFKSFDDPAVMKALPKMRNGEKGFVDFVVEGTHCFAAYAPIKNGWRALLICEYDDVFSMMHKMDYFFFPIMFLALALLFIFSWAIIRKISKPLPMLSAAATQMADIAYNGKMEKDEKLLPLPQISTNDEMGQLVDSFEMLQKNLMDYIETKSFKEQVQGDLNQAKRIQLHFLPRNFTPNIYAFLQPAREVGGDLYQFVVKDEDYLYFIIGDVSGKGMPAALYMAAACVAYGTVYQKEANLGMMMGRINTVMGARNSEMLFVTALMGRFNTKTGHLEFCNAGHNPGVIIEPGKEPRFMDVKRNIALGVSPSFEFEAQEMDLKLGTRLFFYTDGVTESINMKEEQFGEERLLKCLQTPGLSLEELTMSVYDAVTKFAGEHEQFDDITVLTIQY